MRDHLDLKNGVIVPPPKIAVVMITLNEAHNMPAVLENLKGWASEVFVVDSYSADDTVGIALAGGAMVVQKPFRGFGEQWNFALETLPITADWTMKLDPDERLTDDLKRSILKACSDDDPSTNGFLVTRSLWFMDKQLPVSQQITRVWRTGICKFTDVRVNEYPIVDGKVRHIDGQLEHHDSPDLNHWLTKQNAYTTAEAVIRYNSNDLAFKPKLTGDRIERRMWLKRHFYSMPFRYVGLFAYYFFIEGAWRAGRVGLIWARLRCDVMRFVEYKTYEMRERGTDTVLKPLGIGASDPRVKQYE